MDFMEDVEGSEVAVFMAMMVHLILAPATKVEESFNTQAAHDFIYHKFDLQEYDHNQFPGVVPRTFVGPALLSLVVSPIESATRFFGYSATKLWMLLAVRFVLGSVVVVSFLRFARCIRRLYGRETALFLRLLVATQFHFLFYSSRPLPNVFALVLVLHVFSLWLQDDIEWAAGIALAATLLFRCELLLLFCPLFLPSLLTGRLPLFGLRGSAFSIGVSIVLFVLVPSVAFDSLLWGRALWPELKVVRFNVLENRSHEYGTSPWHWYLTSALPRALLGSLPLLPLALLFDRRLLSLVAPVAVFVALYSALPHKELRFILYVFPLLTVPAANLCARLWISKWKSPLRLVASLLVPCLLLSNLAATAVFAYASSNNYPGHDALVWLQHSQRLDSSLPRSVFIDVYAAQNGISRFHHLYPSWEYNKTESLPPSAYSRFDFIVAGQGTGDLKEYVQANFSSHRPMMAIRGFAGFKWRKTSSFPYYYPEMKLKDRVAVLKKKE